MARTQRTPFVILGLLGLSGRQARSGYELKKAIETVISHFWSESDGQLYPVLKQLTSEKLIRALGETKNARRKTLYAITPKGKARLQQWLEAPVEIGKPRDELILKLFFGSETEMPVLIRHLEAQRDRTKATLSQCVHWQKEVAKQRTPYSALILITLRAGAAFCETALNWAEDSIITLRQMPAKRQKQA